MMAMDQALIQLNDGYINDYIGKAKELFTIAKSPGQRHMQLSMPQIEVWELFPKDLNDSKEINTVYYRAKYLNSNNIEIVGNPISGYMSDPVIEKMSGQSRFPFPTNVQIRMIKLLSDSYETN